MTPLAPSVGWRRTSGLLVLALVGLISIIITAPRSLWPSGEPNSPRAPAPPRAPPARPAPPLPTAAAAVADTYSGLAAEGKQLGARAVSLFPDRPQATSLLAGILAETGDLTAATAAWQAHLELHPESAEGWYRLGLFATKEGRDAEAADLLARARRLDPTLPDIQGHLGRCLLKLDRVGEAVEVLEPVVGDDRRRAVRLFQLGHAYLALGRNDDAVTAFQAAIDRTPGYTGAWYGLATAAGRAGREDEAAGAQAEFRRLKSLDATTAAANLARDETVRMRQLVASWYASAGKIAALSGNLPEAEGMWQRGATIAPDHPELGRLLAELARRQGRGVKPEGLPPESLTAPVGSPR